MLYVGMCSLQSTYDIDPQSKHQAILIYKLFVKYIWNFDNTIIHNVPVKH